MDVCWTRTYAGRNPWRVLVVGASVAFSHVDDQGDSDSPGRSRLVCLDLAGEERWTARDFELHAALPDGRLLGTTRSNALRVLDQHGHRQRGAISVKDVRSIRTTTEHVLIKTGRELLVTDPSLHLVDRFAAPADVIPVVVDDAILYLDNDHIMRCDRRGRASALCPIPTALAEEAMARWERETGTPALGGSVIMTLDPSEDLTTELAAAIQDPARQEPAKIGQRFGRFQASLSYVAATRSLFLSSFTCPHVLVCLEPDGRPRWTTYLDPACCGGDPTSLPGGELVVSSGCGGILTWLDASGRITKRTTPHDGVGLATAYSQRVRALADSSCIVDGMPGVVSYDANATLRWISPAKASAYDYDEELGLLVTTSWAADPLRTVTVTCIKNLDARSARA